MVRTSPRRYSAFLLLLASCSTTSTDAVVAPPVATALPGTSSAWLAQLPDGETKRRFVLDCTGCHQFDGRIALAGGRRRSEAEWRAAINRMLGFAGPRSSLPIISESISADSTARWLATSLAGQPIPDSVAAAPVSSVREFLFPVREDLPHDVAITPAGDIVVTGMLSHVMHVLAPSTEFWARVEIPVPGANPRAIEIDRAGNWWVVLGQPGKIARYDGFTRAVSDVGVYAHSIALGENGKSWVNGHFSRDPEVLVEVPTIGQAGEAVELPRHPVLATAGGGPIPYELRSGPGEKVWMSELQGNRIISYDPASGQAKTFTLPKPWSGPRRLDVGPDGIVWIPAYSDGSLVRLDPGAGAFETIPLPLKDAAPYVVRVQPGTGTVCIGTGAADALLEYQPATGSFEIHPLPSHGALVRHLVVDPSNADVWMAYGASPGIGPARIARFRR